MARRSPIFLGRPSYHPSSDAALELLLRFPPMASTTCLETRWHKTLRLSLRMPALISACDREVSVEPCRIGSSTRSCRPRSCGRCSVTAYSWIACGYCGWLHPPVVWLPGCGDIGQTLQRGRRPYAGRCGPVGAWRYRALGALARRTAVSAHLWPLAGRSGGVGRNAGANP